MCVLCKSESVSSSSNKQPNYRQIVKWWCTCTLNAIPSRLFPCPLGAIMVACLNLKTLANYIYIFVIESVTGHYQIRLCSILTLSCLVVVRHSPSICRHLYNSPDSVQITEERERHLSTCNNNIIM